MSFLSGLGTVAKVAGVAGLAGDVGYHAAKGDLFSGPGRTHWADEPCPLCDVVECTCDCPAGSEAT